ncbi:hypothetical protein F5Y01DRAFT_319949 [Xylaria sp. FL0043]|nr:hypothetical protein F5Y01DRAFT_319949 [Xylaria sp. FL0043]
MSEPPSTSGSVDIVYQRVQLRDPNTVEIITIDNQKRGTGYPSEEKTADINEEINPLAALIAKAYLDAPSTDAILTAGGHTNKERLADALVKIDTVHWSGSLRAMLEHGASIYTARRKREAVGVIVLTPLTELIPSMTELSRVPSPIEEVPLPDLSDLDAVSSYALSNRKNLEFMHQLRCNVNSYLRRRATGKLWELCGFGVREKFRRRGIGKALVKHALSQVADAEVMIHAEPGAEAIYQRMGFHYAMSGSGTAYSITIKPEWETGQNHLVFPVMVFRKKGVEDSEDE